MTSVLDVQQVCHIIEILRSGKVLLPVDGVVWKACGKLQLQRRPFRLPCRCLRSCFPWIPRHWLLHVATTQTAVVLL